MEEAIQVPNKNILLFISFVIGINPYYFSYSNDILFEKNENLSVALQSSLIIDKKNENLKSQFFNSEYFKSNQEILNKLREGKISRDNIQSIFNKCSTDDEVLKNPFCVLYLNFSDKIKKLKSKNIREIEAKKKQLQLAVKNKNISFLEKASEQELIQAFSKIKNLSIIKNLSDKIIHSDQCFSSDLLVALGLRLEEQFPDKKYRNDVEKIYERAFSCKKGKSTIHASYRLGLMKIWDGNCKVAESILSDSFNQIDYPKFRMRIGYWRLHCAELLGNEVLQNKMREWLSEEYPLSLHGLVSKIKTPFYNHSATDAKDPSVSYYSKKSPELNLMTRVVEYLIRKSDYRSTFIIYNYFFEKIQKSEFAFQLYHVLLMRQSQNNPFSFQLLAKILKKNPEMMSKSTFEMLYPLHEFEAILKSKTQVNPYLILSLMRQESAFLNNVSSSAGAHGLMQLKLSTAHMFEKRVQKKDLYDPTVNIRIGSKLFSQLMKRYDGKLEYALAAYNAGPGRVKEWRVRYPIENLMLFADLIPNQETREYISSIIRNGWWYNRLYGIQNYFALNKTNLISLFENN